MTKVDVFIIIIIIIITINIVITIFWYPYFVVITKDAINYKSCMGSKDVM